MKKLLTGIILAIMVLSFSITVFAAEMVTDQNAGKDINVQAKAVYVNPNDIYSAYLIDGKADITTKTGEVISISTDGTALDGLMVNVIEIVSTDKEAYSWFSGIMNKFCDKFTAYDIYFTDKSGNRVDVTSEVTVSITTPDGYTNTQVYHISLSAKLNKIASKQSNGNTVFTVKDFRYYVLAAKSNDNSGITGQTPSDNPDSPKTGDTSNMAFWLVLLLVSGGVLTRFAIKKKHSITRFGNDKSPH